MGFANSVPNGCPGCYALDTTRVVPIPGLTVFAITSHRPRNFVSAHYRFSARKCLVGKRRVVAGEVSLPARHDGPDNARGFVGERDGGDAHRLSREQTKQA